MSDDEKRPIIDLRTDPTAESVALDLTALKFILGYIAGHQAGRDECGEDEYTIKVPQGATDQAEIWWRGKRLWTLGDVDEHSAIQFIEIKSDVLELHRMFDAGE